MVKNVMHSNCSYTFDKIHILILVRKREDMLERPSTRMEKKERKQDLCKRPSTRMEKKERKQDL